MMSAKKLNLALETSTRKENLLELPTDMINEISKYLDNESKVCLRMTSKCTTMIKADAPIWNEFISRYKLSKLLCRYKKYNGDACVTMVFYGYTEGIKYLIKASAPWKGAAIDQSKKDGYIYIVHTLISNNTIIDNGELTLLAAVREHFDTLDWLVQNGFRNDLVKICMYAITKGRLCILKHLESKSKKFSRYKRGADLIAEFSRRLLPEAEGEIYNMYSVYRNCKYHIVGENKYMDIALWCVEKIIKKENDIWTKKVIDQIEEGAIKNGNYEFITEFRNAREKMMRDARLDH